MMKRLPFETKMSPLEAGQLADVVVGVALVEEVLEEELDLMLEEEDVFVDVVVVFRVLELEVEIDFVLVASVEEEVVDCEVFADEVKLEELVLDEEDVLWVLEREAALEELTLEELTVDELPTELEDDEDCNLVDVIELEEVLEETLEEVVEVKLEEVVEARVEERTEDELEVDEARLELEDVAEYELEEALDDKTDSE